MSDTIDTNKKCISIEGILGAGKSSVLNILQQNEKLASFTFMGEPLNQLEEFGDDWSCSPILEMYKNPQANMALFQAYVIEVYEKRLEEGFKGNVIMDRGLDSVSVFNLVNEHYYKGFGSRYLWAKYVKVMERFFPKKRVLKTGATDAVIYLDVQPEKALERVQQRGRRYERKITVDYLARLDREYKNYLDRIGMENIPFKVICVDDKKVEDIANEALEYIISLNF